MRTTEVSQIKTDRHINWEKCKCASTPIRRFGVCVHCICGEIGATQNVAQLKDDGAN